jgi:deazaflavin-dependent oxidoreductase (nitroreductase family)
MKIPGLGGTISTMTLDFRPPNALQRGVKRLASTAPVAWLLSKTLRHLDRAVAFLSGGRTTATTLLTGLPVIYLTTTGARSGQPRTTPLIVGVDGDKLIAFATNFGGPKAPAWSYNLRAHPMATVTYRGRSAIYRSREATPEERERYWPLADAIYPGYAAYRRRAAHREIPVFVLERVETSGQIEEEREERKREERKREERKREERKREERKEEREERKEV